MTDETLDKRESMRAFFTLDDNIGVTAIPRAERAVSFPGILLSICVGGMSFFAARQKVAGIQEGDRLAINGIRAPLPLGALPEMEVAIKYILDYPIDVRVVLGCEFTHLPKEERQRIEAYVNERLQMVQENG